MDTENELDTIIFYDRILSNHIDIYAKTETGNGQVLYAITPENSGYVDIFDSTSWGKNINHKDEIIKILESWGYSVVIVHDSLLVVVE